MCSSRQFHFQFHVTAALVVVVLVVVVVPDQKRKKEVEEVGSLELELEVPACVARQVEEEEVLASTEADGDQERLSVGVVVRRQSSLRRVERQPAASQGVVELLERYLLWGPSEAPRWLVLELELVVE